MIKASTVFVLGAGASMPYGFPSGAVLRQHICSSAQEGDQMVQHLHAELGIDPAETGDFAKVFFRSNVASIDTFLAKREQFVEIGKLAIAFHLCLKENPDDLLNANNDDHWYHAIWNALIQGVSSFQEMKLNRVKFISFNYDRSLEHFLHVSMKHTFGIDDAQARDSLRSLEVIHIYGQLGVLGSEVGAGIRPYSAEIHAKALQAAVSGIRVIPEARDGDKIFETARNLFAEANQILDLLQIKWVI